MPTPLIILSWNIRNGGGAKTEVWLRKHLADNKPDRPDFVILQEYNILKPGAPVAVRKALDNTLLTTGYLSVDTKPTSITDNGFHRIVATWRLASSPWTWSSGTTPDFVGYSSGDIVHQTTRATCRLYPVLLHHRKSIERLKELLLKLEEPSAAVKIAVGDFNLDRAKWRQRLSLMEEPNRKWMPDVAPTWVGGVSQESLLIKAHRLPVTQRNEDHLRSIDYVLLQPDAGLRITKLIHHLDTEEVSDHIPIEAFIDVENLNAPVIPALTPSDPNSR